ncbi:768bddba-f0ab-45bd-bee9-c71a10b72206 [Sclerotinia trifoliorum]|uniref:768bddba-f0ab-45bd-bee9-c71a10b72206 n=1 Tax=Sclerotinia trifoliorum TaxID=28548 RepID=A0A8H2VMY5_9HELO|nr:768bddba-f0ab-45bd-bee9-c71a10b72206 [Sclerotinia trifoliorum]
MNITKKPVVTPPQSFICKALLTPPPTNEKATKTTSQVLLEIKRRKIGRSICNNAWEEYELNVEEYIELLRSIRRNKSLQGFVEDKLRYDYFPFAKRFVLRMPLRVHETFIFKIVDELAQQLKFITSGKGQSAEFAKKIESHNSTTLKFEDYSKHDPDGQFKHSRAQHPGVVIEVSFSQKWKYLNRLADAYILGSDGGTRVMVGIDVEYRGTKKVTLSVWQPQLIGIENGEIELRVIQTVKDEIIRDENGEWNKSSQAGLHLQLKDSAPKRIVSNFESVDGPMKDSLFISTHSLCEYLEFAEADTTMIEAKEGIVDPKLFTRKRARSPTPIEELNEDGQRKFRKESRKVEKKAEKDYPQYEPSSLSDAESTSN